MGSTGGEGISWSRQQNTGELKHLTVLFIFLLKDSIEMYLLTKILLIFTFFTFEKSSLQMEQINNNAKLLNNKITVSSKCWHTGKPR